MCLPHRRWLCSKEMQQAAGRSPGQWCPSRAAALQPWSSGLCLTRSAHTTLQSPVRHALQHYIFYLKHQFLPRKVAGASAA